MKYFEKKAVSMELILKSLPKIPKNSKFDKKTLNTLEQIHNKALRMHEKNVLNKNLTFEEGYARGYRLGKIRGFTKTITDQMKK